MKQRDHGTLRGEVSTITLHMEQKQEKERLARERVENLEVDNDAICAFYVVKRCVNGSVGTRRRQSCLTFCQTNDLA